MKNEFPELTKEPLKRRILRLRKKGKLPSARHTLDILYIAKELVASYLFGKGSSPMIKSVKRISKKRDLDILVIYPGAKVKWIDGLSKELLQRKFAENWLKISANPANLFTDLTPVHVLNMVMTSMRCMEFTFILRDILIQLSEDYGASFRLDNRMVTMNSISIVCGFCKDDYQIYELAGNFGSIPQRYHKCWGNKQRQHWWLIF